MSGKYEIPPEEEVKFEWEMVWDGVGGRDLDPANVRKARLEEDKLMNQIQRSKAKITSLEKELTELKDAQMVQQPAPMMQTGTNKELRIALPR